MNAAELKSLLISVTRLTSGQKAELLTALDAGEHGEDVRSILKWRLIEKWACPHCKGL